MSLVELSLNSVNHENSIFIFKVKNFQNFPFLWLWNLSPPQGNQSTKAKLITNF
jgi:hypothetical protein